MTDHIALLRGINVGGRNALPMTELRELLEELGGEDVRTYIQSGNAVFRSERTDTEGLADELRDRIAARHGFDLHVLVIGRVDLEAAMRNNPFPTDDGRTLHVHFLGLKPDSPDLEKLRTVQTATESFELRGTVFYLHAPDGIGRSKLAAQVERCLGVPATARNWNTVRKLAEMAGV